MNCLDKQYPPSNRGFTLVEVLMSMVVLAVVVAAITTMNFSSLTSFTSSRDTTEATYVAQKVIAMIEAESEQWTLSSNSSGVTWAGPSDAIYSNPVETGHQPILTRIISAGNLNWVMLNKDDVPFPSSGLAENNAIGRFCVAARRVPLPNSAPGNVKAIRIQLAVLHPGPGKPSVGKCSNLTAYNVSNISRGLYPGEFLLSEVGTRIEFFSTIVTPPSFME